jgi:hypothetical protein
LTGGGGGGGDGGAASTAPSGAGGAGGSGVIYLRWASTSNITFVSYTGAYTLTTVASGGINYSIYRLTSSGSLVLN